MNDNFERAFGYLIRNEGSFSNNAADSGGATKYGITKGTLARYWNVPVESVSPAVVSLLDINEAKEIYHAWYWEPLQLDDVSLITATVIFDSVVLFGSPTIIKIIQAILPGLKDDGVWGSVTRSALSHAAPADFVPAFQAALKTRIADIIREHPKNEVFESGWLNRVNRFSTLIA